MCAASMLCTLCCVRCVVQEADSIREMEDQLSTSDQLLAMKKQKLKDIELSLMSNLEVRTCE